MHQWVARNAGILVLLVAAFALAELLYFSYTQREQANCQRDVNVQFLDALKDRGSIFERDRRAVTDLAVTLVELSRNDSDYAEKRADAIAKFNTERELIDIELAQFDWPSLRVCD